MNRFLRVAFCLCLSSMTFAQEPAATGQLRGILRDPSGAVVPGGRIAVKNLETGETQSTSSGPQGQFRFDGLPPGRYQLSAEVPGFEVATRSEIEVAAGQESVAELTLRIVAATAAVEVTAAAITISSAEVVPERARISDISALLGDLPGVSLYGGGGLSSLPVMHGLNGDRVNVLVNGMAIEASCSNHMNPPLSYVSPASVGWVSILAGITPVSKSGDSLGGTIAVEPAPPAFALAGRGIETHGSIAGSHRTNTVVNSGNASLAVATASFAAAYTGSYVTANNYKDGLGRAVKSTFYESTNHTLQLAARHGNNVLTLALGFQYIPEQGFVNARMDMTHNNAKYVSLRYDRPFEWGTLEARAYYQHARHQMNILRDKIPGMFMPMESRGTNLGYAVHLEVPLTARDTLLFGNEFRRFLLDEWWPPVQPTVGSMGPDTFWNVRDGQRNRMGFYFEWEGRRSDRWTTLLGIRSDVVWMNAGDVSGYNMSPAATGSAAYYADAVEFNSRERHRRDANFDATALARYTPNGNYTLEFGYARKSRSPNLYERYLWAKRSAMSAQMNGWFGDANGYAGNLDLRPEVGHTVSATAAWHSAANRDWELRITPYYTRVLDYIDVVRCPVILDGSSGCTAARFAATSGFVTLQFANHDARLHGVDALGRMPLGGNSRFGKFSLSGSFGYVRGRNLESRDNLYQIMPANARLAVEHRRGEWSTAVSFRAVDAKRDVQAVRNELRTPGYLLMDVKSGYQWHPAEGTAMRLDAGIDNLANRNYALPLGGRYWIGDSTGKTPVPGTGRTFYAGLSFQF